MTSPPPSRPWLIGPAADALCLFGAPLVALALGLSIGWEPFFAREVRFGSLNPGFHRPLAILAIEVFIAAHLVIVFVRSHLNRRIFASHPLRFTVVPAALLAAAWVSPWCLIFLTVLAIWWDVYHSALQTFGIGRIYDQRYGNDVEAGRRADQILNVAIYVGPVLAGTNLWSHLKHFQLFERVDAHALASLGDLVFAHSESVRTGVLAVGVPVVAGYLLHYRGLIRRGYRVPPQKVVLLVSTALCSIVAWGFLPPALAFFIMNFFHAFQYFAIVWWTERDRYVPLLGLGRLPFRGLIGLVVLGVPAFGYGFWVTVQPEGMLEGTVAVAVVVSILHFWYDGFIWSVRRRQV